MKGDSTVESPFIFFLVEGFILSIYPNYFN